MSERIDAVRRRRWPEDVYRRAQSLLVNTPDLSAASVADALATEFDPTPSERTITDWLAKGVIRRPDPSELWSVAASDSETARLVLPVLAGVIQHTRGGVRRFTNSEAAWIAKLQHLSAGAVPAWECYRIARAYIHFEANEVDTTPLDHYLALVDWRKYPLAGETGWLGQYSRAVSEWGVEWIGFVEAPPMPAMHPIESGEEGDQ